MNDLAVDITIKAALDGIREELEAIRQEISLVKSDSHGPNQTDDTDPQGATSERRHATDTPLEKLERLLARSAEGE